MDSNLFSGAAVAEDVAVETDEQKIARLEGDIDDLQAAAQDDRQQIKSLEEEIQAKDKEIGDLGDEINELKSEAANSDALEKALEFYADPANWTGNTLTPYMPTIYVDPYDTARVALQEAN